MIDIQHRFFEMLRTRIKKDDSLPLILSELLNISSDSAYRRLRGETALSLEETVRIAEHFGISIDEFLARNINAVVFHYNWIDPAAFDYKQYLQAMVADLQSISLFKENRIIYLAKDIPIFYNFLIPEIAAFKSFFWKKSAFQHPEFRDQKFNLDELDAEEVALGQEISRIYSIIPSVEMWNDEAIKSLLNQIQYYYHAGYFAKPYHADKLVDRLEQMVEHFALQAEAGCKFLFGKDPASGSANYELYYNELILGDNTVFVEVDGHRRVYHSTNVINTMYTTLQEYCHQTYSVQMNLLKSAQRISASSEKERNQYFNRLRNQIEKARNSMDN
jgi:hypothetical protein